MKPNAHKQPLMAGVSSKVKWKHLKLNDKENSTQYWVVISNERYSFNDLGNAPQR